MGGMRANTNTVTAFSLTCQFTNMPPKKPLKSVECGPLGHLDLFLAVIDPDEAGAEPNNNKHFGESFHEK